MLDAGVTMHMHLQLNCDAENFAKALSGRLGVVVVAIMGLATVLYQCEFGLAFWMI